MSDRDRSASEVPPELADTVASTGETVRPAAEGSSHPDARLARGAELGRYVVLDCVGAGGMGVVYAAYDPTLDRKVALKLVLGETSDPDQAELLREAQAMARLQHPNVAAVHDVGRLGDSVFMAMEFVEGETLGDYTRSLQRLGRNEWREIVRIFVAAGRGLAAAHAKGLVHRDFKPGNVVVGSDGRPRVLDFGLARATGERPGATAGERSTGLLSSQHTRVGLKAGTPAYMSPEQIDGIPAGPASDQFSFCIALWDALYGDLPFAGETLVELRDSMRSGRLREAATGTQVPAFIRPILRRGLAEKPEDRYPDLEALLDELSRDPLARRRRVLAWSGAVAALAVAVTVAWLALARQRSICSGAEAKLDGIWDATRRADVERAFGASGSSFAAGASQRVAATLDDFAQGWVAMRTDACEATRVRGEQSEELLDLRMTCLDSLATELDQLTTIFASADAETVAGSVRAAQGLTPVERCADSAALLAPTRQPVDPGERAQVAAVREQLARSKALGLAGKRAEALALAEAAVAAPITFRPARAEALAELGGHYKKVDKVKEAEDTLDRALVEALASRHPLASVEAADAHFWLALDLKTNLERARFWLDYGRAAASSLGPEVARDLLLDYSEAALLRRSGDLEGALAVLARAQPVAENEPAGRSLLPYILWMRADTLVVLGRPNEARPIQERGLEIDLQDLGPSHPDIAFDLQVLARIDEARDEFDLAEAGLRRAVVIAGEGKAPDQAFVADLLVALAEIQTAAGRPQEALRTLEQASATKVAALGPHTEEGAIHHARGEALRALGRPAEALEAHREALRVRAVTFGDEHPWTAQSRGAIGRDLLALGRPAEAVPELRRSIDELERQGEARPELSWLRFDLARALSQSGGDDAEVLRLVEAARSRVAAEGGHPARLAAEIEAWLAGLPTRG